MIPVKMSTTTICRKAVYAVMLTGVFLFYTFTVVISGWCVALFHSAHYQKLLQIVHQLFASALDDISDFCQSNSWLSDVWRYCSTWNQSQLERLKGAPVFDVKVQPIFHNQSFPITYASYLFGLNSVGSFAVLHKVENSGCHLSLVSMFNLIICGFVPVFWHIISVCLLAFSALTLLVGCQEGHPARKNLTDEVLLQQNLEWFILLVPTHPGSPGQRVVKWL